MAVNHSINQYLENAWEMVLAAFLGQQKTENVKYLAVHNPWLYLMLFTRPGLTCFTRIIYDLLPWSKIWRMTPSKEWPLMWEPRVHHSKHAHPGYYLAPPSGTRTSELVFQHTASTLNQKVITVMAGLDIPASCGCARWGQHTRYVGPEQHVPIFLNHMLGRHISQATLST